MRASSQVCVIAIVARACARSVCVHVVTCVRECGCERAFVVVCACGCACIRACARVCVRASTFVCARERVCVIVVTARAHLWCAPMAFALWLCDVVCCCVWQWSCVYNQSLLCI